MILLYFLLITKASSFVRTYSHYPSIKPLFDSNKIDLRDKSIVDESIGELIKDIDNGKVGGIYFDNNMKIAWAMHDIDDELEITDFTRTTIDPSISSTIIEHANKRDVKTTILQPPLNPIGNLFGALYSGLSFIILPAILFSIFRSFRFMNGEGGPMNNMNDRINQFNKIGNQDMKNELSKSNISLANWAGSPEIFQECTEIVGYLNDKTLYEAAGAEVPKGILLEGPPGTGKTLIAKAIASECDAGFISVSASEFVELFVGMGASKVRNLFKKARENQPCIIFIDEIDAVGKQRGTGVNVGNDEREQTLNQLLAEMDGFSTNDNVLIIAATNRKDVLDSALLRPGRFDRIVQVPLPDKPSRKSILEVHSQNKTLSKDVSLDIFAEVTAGYSGAQLKNLLNEAAINAARESKAIISNENIKDALEKLTVGIIRKNDTRTYETIKRVCLHELGHAYLTATFNDYFNLKKVSIKSTYNGAGGYTLFGEKPDIVDGGMYTKDILKKRIIIALGGKAAESIFYGDDFVSVGASNDLMQANNLAKRMIGNYGMGDSLKTYYNSDSEGKNPFLGRTLAIPNAELSDKTKEIFDKEVRELVDECYKEAIRILQTNKSKVNVLANILYHLEILEGDVFTEYLNLSPEDHTLIENEFIREKE
jgi:cell division protease FtsH